LSGRPKVGVIRFLFHADHGLIGANASTFAAVRERLRLEVAGQPSTMSDIHVLVFKRGDGRYLRRRNVLVKDGDWVLALPGCRLPGGGSEIRLERAPG
jgi:hypothetical protein